MHWALRQACMLLRARQGKKKNPVYMLLPGGTLQGFSYECVTVHACVCFWRNYYGRLCIYRAWQKIILLTVWKINDASLSLPSSAEPGGGPCDPHGGALTQRQISLKCP